MKTRNRLIPLFLLISLKINAQWVNIPDNNFVIYLQQNYSSCMNGSLLDTTCADILNAKTVYCTFSVIQNLYGIQYFDSLTWLDCSNNPLSLIPALPPQLQTLLCTNVQLSELPDLPPTLQYLDCSGNNIDSLPSLPSSVTQIHCYNNQLTFLPNLPSQLIELYCYNNQLQILPQLPQSLRSFNVSNNQLSFLPPLPDSLELLWCYNNQISCFPTLPNTLTDTMLLLVDNNPFTCFPNYVPAMTPSNYLTYPLCINNDPLNNPNQCQGFKGITGNTFIDNNQNCSLDFTEGFAKNISVQLLDSSNNLLTTFFTTQNGLFNFYADSGTYTVRIDTTNKSYSTSCLYPGLDSTLVLTSNNPLANDVNFEVSCKPGFDNGVKSIFQSGIIFPNQPFKLNINAGDLTHWYNLNCSAGISGIVTITITGPANFDSIPYNAITPTNISGNTFTYSISDFGSLQNDAFKICFTTDTSAHIGNNVCVNIDVSPTAGDNAINNNYYLQCFGVSNSFDPNDKQVYPTNVPAFFNDYLTYTIRFQNTGNAPALNIRIVDTLNGNLDLSTLEIINYSHANTSTLNANIVTFSFPNIQLPDSFSNAEGSQGFIQYRIKPSGNLPLGTQITNNANIYFDFNTPITTNTVTTLFTNTTSIQELKEKSFYKISPNPNNGVFQIEFDKNNFKTKKIELLNMLGSLILKTQTNEPSLKIDLSSLPVGIYMLKANDDNKFSNSKLIIE